LQANVKLRGSSTPAASQHDQKKIPFHPVEGSDKVVILARANTCGTGLLRIASIFREACMTSPDDASTPIASNGEASAAGRAHAAEQPGTSKEAAVRYSMSPALSDFLGSQQICVADRNTVLLATLFQIIKFRNVLDRDQQINNLHDACYVPRELFITGELDVHDIGVLKDGRIVFVNTLYNCLASTSERHSFLPLWKPPFISKIIKEDRCHLNGLAMEDGMPRYVTAVSRSDTVDGWRDRRSNGGIVVDVRSGEIVASGLSMPHSPRLYRGRLWVLNSGTGEIGWIERGSPAAIHVLAFCPGFVRGLAFHGKYALVGLSKPRYERFEGLPLDRKLAQADSEPWCGMQVINIDTGVCEHWFRIDGAVTELYDLGVVPDVVRPMAIGFSSDEILHLITHDALDPELSSRT
jgi:uncharacterized protein (TIGR03032 family)